ncbi:MAG: glycosyltransferase family 2 protein [Vicinamibacterales bacterium]
MTTVVFALVHYRNTAAIEAAVARLRALKVPAGWAVDVVIADNSGDAPLSLPAPVVRDDTNRGYLGGAARAFDHWRGQHGQPPAWFVIINPDAEPRTDALERLAGTKMPDDVGMVAPGVLLGGVTPQNPFLARRPSRARMRFYTVAFRSPVLTRMLDVMLALKRLRARQIPPAGEPRAIYAPHGSMVFVRSAFFERGGTLSYRGFMFGEEIHLAEQARRLGLRILFVPSIEVIHDGGSTTGQVDSVSRREWHRASADVLWEDYFRSSGD